MLLTDKCTYYSEQTHTLTVNTLSSITHTFPAFVPQHDTTSDHWSTAMPIRWMLLCPDLSLQESLFQLEITKGDVGKELWKD